MTDSSPSPLIQLEKNATAPVLRYDLPEPTSYSGINFIQLNLDIQGGVFKPSVLSNGGASTAAMLSSQPVETIKRQIKSYLKSGITGANELGFSGGLSMDIGAPDDRPIPPPPDPQPPDDPADPRDLALAEIAQKVKNGERVVVDENVNGDGSISTVPVPVEPDPHLYLVETVRMTSYLGDYGAGRVVKTFSLLPGESAKISIKTYKQTESTAKRSSSVLDSVTKESADDLQNSLQQEQSDQKSYQKSSEYYADVKAKARWGWGSASAKAGIKGSTNSTREEATKNISNATETHSSKASAKRDVEINTSFEVTEKEGEETSIEREIENINVSRTLNFVFRQMNQAFISFVHLTDIRIAFFDGRRESRIEVPISSIDSLLEMVIKPSKVDEVKSIILEQLTAVRDHNGILVDVIEEVSINPNDKFIKFNSELKSVYSDPETEVDYKIPGVLLAVNKYVMRTEGVIVESILGEGTALDKYALKLQQGEVDRRAAEVRALKATAQREELLNELVNDGDTAKADLLVKLTCPCRESEPGAEET